MIKKTEEKKTEEKTEYTVRVIRASQYKEGAFAFDMEVNGVSIYGCWLKQGTNKDGKDYSFIDFPSYKAKNGEYYKYAWFPINKELHDLIEAQIESML